MYKLRNRKKAYRAIEYVYFIGLVLYVDLIPKIRLIEEVLTVSVNCVKLSSSVSVVNSGGPMYDESTIIQCYHLAGYV